MKEKKIINKLKARVADGGSPNLAPMECTRVIERVTAIQLCYKTWNAVIKLIEDSSDPLLTIGGKIITEPRDKCGETGPWIEMRIVWKHREEDVAYHGDYVIQTGGRISVKAPKQFLMEYKAI